MRHREHIVRPLIVVLSTVAFMSCANLPGENESGFTYKNLPIAKNTVEAGEGSQVNFKGTPLSLSGSGIREGDTLRNVPLAQGDLSLIDLTETKGQIRIISVVPSLDTTVCEQQTHYLSEKNQGLDQSVQLLTISVDTPFAQTRFAKEANIRNVTFLSDYRGSEFGKTYGLLLEKPYVLARALLVIDEDNVVRYMQVTPDLAHMPDMDAAFRIARSLVGSQSPAKS